MRYSKEALVKLAKFTDTDLAIIRKRNKRHTRIGFAYQLAYVKLYNRFPNQQPLEINQEIVNYVSIQIEVPVEEIHFYDNRQKTVSEHQDLIRHHLQLQRFNDLEMTKVAHFLFEQSCQLEQTHALLSLLRNFLRENSTLEPAESTLRRLIQQERQRARDYIFDKIDTALSAQHKSQLDQLLDTKNKSYSDLQKLKQISARASSSTIIKITKKLDQIKYTGILSLDLSWLNNNLQRWMNRYVRKSTASRLRKLSDKKRYGLLVCFLKQHYLDMTDDLVKTYDKVMSQMYNRTQVALDKQNRKERKSIKSSLTTFHTLSDMILDETIADALLRTTIFERVDKKDLSTRRDHVKDWLNGKYKDVFTLLVNTRYSYLRQFAPSLLEHLSLEKEDAKDDSLLKSVQLIKEMNLSGKRKMEALVEEWVQQVCLKFIRERKLFDC